MTHTKDILNEPYYDDRGYLRTKEGWYISREFVIELEQSNALLEQKNKELVEALQSVQHEAESQRVWNGMGYTVTNPVCGAIVQVCEKALRNINEVKP